jgi:hypothetical protein
MDSETRIQVLRDAAGAKLSQCTKPFSVAKAYTKAFMEKINFWSTAFVEVETPGKDVKV